MIQIEWNDTKCTGPQDCCQCLDVCPEGVFMTYPRDKRGPGKAAANWAIMPAFMKLCTGCRICEQICPENALTVIMPEESVA